MINLLTRTHAGSLKRSDARGIHLPRRFVLGPKKMFSYTPIFQLVGATPGHTAMAEMFIRVDGKDMEPGLWRLRVSRRGRGVWPGRSGLIRPADWI
jgi:hypothetical protein